MDSMPIDLAQVDWLYVILLAVFVAISTFLGGLLSFRRRGTAAVLSAGLFAVIFVFWTYYPHRVPFLPRTLTTAQDTAKQTPAPPPAAPATSQKPATPTVKTCGAGRPTAPATTTGSRSATRSG